MEKIIKNKSVLLGLAMLVVFGFGLLAPSVGYAACSDIICLSPSTCVEDPVARCVTSAEPTDYVTDPTAATTATTDATTETPAKSGGFSLWDAFTSFDELIGKGLAIIFNLALTVLSWVLALTAGVFSASIEYTLSGSYLKLTVIKSAWTICRDLANVFFVFILLYISLATILQLSGKTMKDLLIKTLIYAVLLNFSYTITGIIIDASNVVAIEFYNKANGGSTGSPTVTGFTAKIMNGLNLNTLWKEPSSAVQQGNKIMSTIIAGILGSILIIIVMCIFLIGTFMFAARSVTFMFLLILSPLAFAASALPGGVGGASGYSTKWWKELTNNAIFAPVFMFLLYLVVEIINSKALFKITEGFGDLVAAGASGTSASDAIISLMLNYILVIGLLMGTIMVAKGSGVAGAAYATGKFDKLQKYGTDKAKGAASMMTAGVARRTGGAILGTGVGQRAVSGIARIPLVGGAAARGLQNVQNANAARVGQIQTNKYAGRTNAQLMQLSQPSMFNRMGTFDKAALLQQMQKQNLLGGIDPNILRANLRVMGRHGMNTGTILAGAFGNTGFGPEAASILTDQAILNSLRPSDVASLPANSVNLNPNFVNALITTSGTPQHLQTMMNRGDRLSQDFAQEMRNLGGPGESAAVVAASIAGTNQPLATWLATNAQARTILGLNP